MALPPKLGGLGIPIFAEMAKGEFENSRKLTGHLTKNIVNQEIPLKQDQGTKKIKQEMRSAKSKSQNETLKTLREEMDPAQLKLNELACAKGASSWLTILPQLKRLPATCECGSPFDLQHALSCKKGGFVSLRHNELRNIIALMLKTICKDVVTEPPLQPLTGEDLQEVSAIVGDEARLDVRARGFWQTGQTAFLTLGYSTH